MKNKGCLFLAVLLVIFLTCACSTNGTDSSEESHSKMPRVAESYEEVEFGGALLSIPDYFGDKALSDDGLTLSYSADDSTQLSFLDYDEDISNYSEEEIDKFRNFFFETFSNEMGTDLSIEPDITELANGMSIAKAYADYESEGTTLHIITTVITDPSSNIAIGSALVQNSMSEYDYEDEYYKMIDEMSPVETGTIDEKISEEQPETFHWGDYKIYNNGDLSVGFYKNEGWYIFSVMASGGIEGLAQYFGPVNSVLNNNHFGELKGVINHYMERHDKEEETTIDGHSAVLYTSYDMDTSSNVGVAVYTDDYGHGVVWYMTDTEEGIKHRYDGDILD